MGAGYSQLKDRLLNMAWEPYSEGPSQKVLIVIAHKASLDQCEQSENELWPFPLLLQLVQREEGREGEKVLIPVLCVTGPAGIGAESAP